MTARDGGSGDGSETGTVTEGKKSTTSIDATLTPDFRGKEQRNITPRFKSLH